MSGDTFAVIYFMQSVSLIQLDNGIFRKTLSNSDDESSLSSQDTVALNIRGIIQLRCWPYVFSLLSKYLSFKASSVKYSLHAKSSLQSDKRVFCKSLKSVGVNVFNFHNPVIVYIGVVVLA